MFFFEIMAITKEKMLSLQKNSRNRVKKRKELERNQVTKWKEELKTMNRDDFKFEICANSVESCLAAQEGGANRVELCAGIPEGGTTPSYGEIKVARKLLNETKLHVIIRPRGGDFLYTPLEIERMEEDIRLCRELGVDGVVIGCLTEDGEVDMEANRRLVELAKGDSELKPMSVTFHRAFDRAANPQKALEDIISLGCDRILTSGQQPKAVEGVALLAELKKIAAGRIILLAGCGVNEDNIRTIFDATDIHEYHFAARVNVPSKMKQLNANVYMGAEGADEANSLVTSAERVKQTIANLLD